MLLIVCWNALNWLLKQLLYFNDVFSKACNNNIQFFKPYYNMRLRGLKYIKVKLVINFEVKETIIIKMLMFALGMVSFVKQLLTSGWRHKVYDIYELNLADLSDDSILFCLRDKEV